MKNNRYASWPCRLLTLVVVCALVVSMFISAYATTTANDAVTSDRNGVLCIEYGYIQDSTFYPWSVGSAFLINENTLLTCYHVVHLTDLDAHAIMEDNPLYPNGYDAKWEKHMAIQVILANGSEIAATEALANGAIDYSVLTLSQQISNHELLQLRSNESVKTSEPIYALGFPYVVQDLTDGVATKFTADDVTVTSGTISKEQAAIGSINYIQHNAVLKDGNSGGPLVDVNGNVVGINAAVDAETGTYGYAIAIEQVTLTLDQLGIEYKSAESGAQTPPPPSDANENVDKTALNAAINEAAGKNSDNYTSQSWGDFSVALNEARAVASNPDATQQEVDAATNALYNVVLVEQTLEPNDDAAGEVAVSEKPAGINPILIAGIIAAVVIVIVAVVVIVVVNSGKKGGEGTKSPAYPPYEGESRFAPVGGGTAPGGSGGFASVIPQDVNYGGVYGSGVGETDVLSGGAGETSVLSAGLGETSILSGKPYAILVRKVSGEQISVSASSFTIGKERRRVDYCISNNNAVSRSHAKLVNDNGTVGIVDLGSKNGTFVNGVKCSPNVSVRLNNGDTVTLADEDFEVKLI